jgi:WS/DGAT/MGAT family acyltransferase
VSRAGSRRTGAPKRRAARGTPAATRRLGGEDSGLLALDLADQPMSILFMIVLGQEAGDGERLTVTDLRERVEKRLDYLPALRWRLVPVPGRLHHPLWVDDPDFDIANHVSSVRIPAPGDTSQLAESYARLIARPISRSRPMWDLTLLDGLSDGRQAIVWRFHHCLMDGLASLTALGRFFASDEELSVIEPVAYRPGELPTRRELLGDALAEQAHSWRQLPELMRRTRTAVSGRDAFAASSPVPVPRAPDDVPPCSLNDFGPRRSFSMLELDLDDLRLIREVAGVTYTDVALAAVAGGLRAVMTSRGELPSRPLVAECPISLEDPDAPERLWGNRFTNVLTSLATDIDDPWERLARIATVTAAAREGFETVGGQLWDDWLETLPPFLSMSTMRGHYRRRRAHRELANANVVMTSVRGPSQPWRLGQFVAEEVWGAGPPANGVGSLVAFISYAGKVFVGINSVEGSLSDPGLFVRAARETVAELLREASARRAG